MESSTAPKQRKTNFTGREDGSLQGKRKIKEYIHAWEGKYRSDKKVRGGLRASGESLVKSTLRRQGGLVGKVKKRTLPSGKKVTENDITLFMRQPATMM